jgi:hypothetical protein
MEFPKLKIHIKTETGPVTLPINILLKSTEKNPKVKLKKIESLIDIEQHHPDSS